MLKNNVDNDIVNDTEKSLKRNLRTKGILIPIIFSIIVVVACVFLASSKADFFPSGNHHDSLTTTAPTQTTEFNENEYAHIVQD